MKRFDEACAPRPHAAREPPRKREDERPARGAGDARPSSWRRRKTAPPTRGTRSRASGATLREKTEGARRGDPAALRRGRDRDPRARLEAKKAAAEKALRQQVQRIDQLIERVHKRAEAEDLTLKEADKAARDLRAAIETPLTAAAPRARVPRRAAQGGARRARRRSCTSCARWTSGSGSPTPPSRKS